MPHYGSPDKVPAVRLDTLDRAGKARIPFTTGILIGIGETRRERIESDLDLSLVLGELSSALQELEPDLRRVVIARHFEGLELAELARREGVGLTTVKARLKRAHGELRQTLDRSDGGRQRWMLALVPLGQLPVPAPPIPASPPSLSWCRSASAWADRRASAI